MTAPDCALPSGKVARNPASRKDAAVKDSGQAGTAHLARRHRLVEGTEAAIGGLATLLTALAESVRA
jgi:hypothetical protein